MRGREQSSEWLEPKEGSGHQRERCASNKYITNTNLRVPSALNVWDRDNTLGYYEGRPHILSNNLLPADWKAF
jgi:hypothetical protein